MLKPDSANNVTHVSCTTTTLVEIHTSNSGIIKQKRSSKTLMKTSNGFMSSDSPASSSQSIVTTPATNHNHVTSRTSTGGDGRPPFVTTVCRGKFLPSKFDLLMVERSLFTFSSRPRPVGIVTKHQCSMAGGAPMKEHNLDLTPRGVHDYYNMMWDPHIYRGKATTTIGSTAHISKLGENEEEGKVGDGSTSLPDISQNQPKNIRKKRGAYYGMPHSTNVSATYGSSTRTRGSRYRIMTRVTTKTKGLNKLGMTDERHHTHVQTDQFLQDLASDLDVEENDAIVQTEPLHDFPMKNKRGKDPYISRKRGVDACTEILPGELVTFDQEVQPFVEATVGKILQQALVETMEEEEIATLKEQQNQFLEKRRKEEKLLRQLQEEHERITKEKERLKSALHSLNPDDSGLIQERLILEQALRGQPEINSQMSSSYLLELLPSVLNSLRQEGYFSDNVADDLFSTPGSVWRSSSKVESQVPGPITGERTTSSDSTGTSVDQEEPSKLTLDEHNQEDNGDHDHIVVEENQDEMDNRTDENEPDEAKNEPDEAKHHEDEKLLEVPEPSLNEQYPPLLISRTAFEGHNLPNRKLSTENIPADLERRS